MAGRKRDPDTPYKVYPHRQQKGKYQYAAVQVPQTDKPRPKINHVGTLKQVDGKTVFIPNAGYRLMPVEERLKLIFPEDWDITNATAMNEDQREPDTSQLANRSSEDGNDRKASDAQPNPQTEKPPVVQGAQSAIRPLPGDLPMSQYNHKLYGSFWLLQEIGINAGVYDDLMTTFNNNIPIVHEILSLAYYPCISGKGYSRFASWQNSHQTLIDYRLSSPAISKLTESITDTHRMTMIKLRLAREPKNVRLDCDLAARSGYGKYLVNLCRGTDRDDPKLQNTVEAHVSSLTTHEPVYYRSFPGNTTEISAIRTILSDLQALGIPDVVFTSDRDPSEENLAALVQARIPFLMCTKVENTPISSLLSDIQYDEDGLPLNMRYDVKRRLYYTQMDIPAYRSRLADGTEVQMSDLMANLFMDPRHRSDELEGLRSKISQESALLEQAVAEGKIPEDIRQYNALFDYFKVVYTVDEQKTPTGISYTRCEEKIRGERAQCGFFGSVMFKAEINAAEVLDEYEHEKNFDQLSNQMMFSNQWDSSHDGRNGRSFISFIGLISMSKVIHAWKASMRDEYESPLDMVDEMESIRCIEYPDNTSRMSTFTTKQVQIATACGVKPPPECIPATLRKAMDRKENPEKCPPESMV